MKSKMFLSVAIAVVGVCSLVATVEPSPKAALLTLQSKIAVTDRIQRVENGLLPATIIKGQPATMKLADRMAHYKTLGVSVAVINNGAIEWAKAYGVVEVGGTQAVTTETMFQAASISKPVAAMGALRLVEQGKLSLDEDVNLKLKSWKTPENEFTKEQKVTLRRLVSHSAGLTVHGFRGYMAGEPVPTLTQALDGQKPANSAPIRVDTLPGSKWRYSGGGYNVMQQLIIDVTGKSFPDFMREAVLERIGMANSAYEQPLPPSQAGRAAVGHRMDGTPMPGKWVTHPEMAAAGLWTTATDLARFAIAVINAKMGKSNRLISREMAAQMLTKQIGDWGLGVSLAGEGKTFSFGHGGSNLGFKCQLVAFPETGQGAAVMTNGDQGSRLVAEIIRAVAREYGWGDWLPVERTLATVNPEIFKAYVGEYEVKGNVTISTEGGKLFVQPPGGSKMELFPSSETEFFALAENLRLVFAKDEQGAVSGLTAHLGGSALNGKKVK